MKKLGALLFAICLLVFSPINVFAASSPELVHDFGDDEGWSYDMVQMNGNRYFAHYDTITYGGEIWVTDDTGTHILKDIRPGNNSSDPSSLTVFNNKLYFSACDDENGCEIWMSDGTSDGTQILGDLVEGPNSSYPQDIVVVNNHLVFTAYDSASRYELWQSDGTPEGTGRLIASLANDNLRIGRLSSASIIGNHLYFSGESVESENNIIWKTDGTMGGTEHVAYIPSRGTPNLFAANGKIYFIIGNFNTEQDEFWQSDGTDSGTSMVKAISDVGNYFNNDYIYGVKDFGNKVAFVAYDYSIGSTRLYISDGTESGTIELTGNATSINQDSLTIYGDTLYFVANDNDIYGNELYKTDGTVDGTQIAADLTPGADDTWIDEVYYAGSGQIYLLVYTETTTDGSTDESFSLYQTDGTISGTKLVSDRLALGEGPYMTPTIIDGYIYYIDATDHRTYNWGDGDVRVWDRGLTMMRYTPQPADDQPTPTDTPSTPNLVQNIVSAITDIFDPPETNAPTTSVATVSKPVTNVTTDTDTTNQSPSADQNTPNIWPFILGGIGFIGIIIFALLRKKDKK